MMVNRRISSSPASVPEMDPGIWSKLPVDLLEHVLSFLPLKTFLNLRSTCRRFKALIFSPSFISKHSSSPFSSFLLLAHPHFHRLHLPIFDSIVGSWRKLSLPLSRLLPDAAPSVLISTSKGLLCFSLPNSSSFLVCNLLAKSSRLIEFPTHPFAFDVFTFVSTSVGYKIFMLSSGSASTSAFVYDSRSDSWQQFGGFDPILSDNCHQEGVFSNGCLYFTTPEPFSVVSFDLETGNWGNLVSELPPELTFVRLVSNGEGKVYMIGGIGRNGISRSMKLWELELELGGEGKWAEVEILPDMMCRKFVSVCYHNYEHVYCLWHQGMICVCCYTWPEVLYYKVSRKTWHWLPKCPSLPDKWSCGFRWFSFAPELHAFV